MSSSLREGSCFQLEKEIGRRRGLNHLFVVGQPAGAQSSSSSLPGSDYSARNASIGLIEAARCAGR